MAYAFPLTLAQFLQRLPLASVPIEPSIAGSIDETGGGESLIAAMGTHLWEGRLELGEMRLDEASEIMPLIDILRRPGASFHLSDLQRPAPRLDPQGAAIASSTPTLGAVASTMREIKVSGLPSGYGLNPGDWLSFSYGSNPTRRALHRLVGEATAGGGGNTDWVEVSPNIRAGYTLGSAVALTSAICKAVIVPGTFEPGRHSGTRRAGVAFQWRQTLR